MKEKYKKQVNASSINGQVRLNAEGTDLFRKVIKNDPNKFNEFFEKLKLELADAIPISSERVTTSKKFQIDTSVNPERIILSINIQRDETGLEIPVNLAVEHLDTLIRNKFITPISSGEFSRYLDEDFGYKRIRKNSCLKIIQMKIYIGEHSQRISEPLI